VKYSYIDCLLVVGMLALVACDEPDLEPDQDQDRSWSFSLSDTRDELYLVDSFPRLYDENDTPILPIFSRSLMHVTHPKDERERDFQLLMFTRGCPDPNSTHDFDLGWQSGIDCIDTSHRSNKPGPGGLAIRIPLESPSIYHDAVINPRFVEYAEIADTSDSANEASSPGFLPAPAKGTVQLLFMSASGKYAVSASGPVEIHRMVARVSRRISGGVRYGNSIDLHVRFNDVEIELNDGEKLRLSGSFIAAGLDAGNAWEGRDWQERYGCNRTFDLGSQLVQVQYMCELACWHHRILVNQKYADRAEFQAAIDGYCESLANLGPQLITGCPFCN